MERVLVAVGPLNTPSSGGGDERVGREDGRPGDEQESGLGKKARRKKQCKDRHEERYNLRGRRRASPLRPGARTPQCVPSPRVPSSALNRRSYVATGRLAAPAIAKLFFDKLFVKPFAILRTVVTYSYTH